MNKLKIAVLFGGCSPEYDVSLKSAYSVISHMDCNKYEPILIGITRCGEWFIFTGEITKIENDTWNNSKDCTKALISPDRETKGVLIFNNEGIDIIKLDAAMPILHGKNGEDGTVQGLLELAGIPIVGCDNLSSALCMDKVRAHKLANVTGIRTAGSFVLHNESDMLYAQSYAKKLGYPLFVKPVKAGSSFGVSKVLNEDDLPAAIMRAFEHDNLVIIEENIDGFEVGCAVLGNQDLIIGHVDEIELSKGFFDYTEKYNLETCSIHVPARITPYKADEIREVAKTIYKALGCSGFARVDMFLTPDGEIIFNEVNTIPGFTPNSRYPSMLKAIGMTFEEIIDTVIELAVQNEQGMD